MLYLDDVTLGGAEDDIHRNLRVINEAESLGLVLNNAKSEIICDGVSVMPKCHSLYRSRSLAI